MIIGCPGAGKSTFAVTLAKQTNLPLIHLDYYFFDLSYGYNADKTAWKERVAKLAQGNRWIIEGNYKSTLSERLSRADTIIYFDYPRYVILWRMLKRRIQYHGSSRPGMPASYVEKIDPNIVKLAWSFKRTNKPVIDKVLEKYKGSKKIIILKKASDAAHFLESIR